MALVDSATLKIATGYFYKAPTGTAVPTDVRNPETDWINIGHTSLDDIFSQSSEGGDQTTLGTLQASSLRTSTSARTESFTFNVAQWDAESLKLYFGSNAEVAVDGPGASLVGVPDNPTPVEGAFLAVFLDGDENLVFYAPKSETSRADDFSISDTTSLQLLPIKVTPLNYNGSTNKYYVGPKASA